MVQPITIFVNVNACKLPTRDHICTACKIFRNTTTEQSRAHIGDAYGDLGEAARLADYQHLRKRLLPPIGIDLISMKPGSRRLLELYGTFFLSHLPVLHELDLRLTREGATRPATRGVALA